MKIEDAKKVISKAVGFFDIRSGSKVDFITEGKKVIFIDPLGIKIEAQPTEVGNNNYNLVQETCRLQHQIKFQNGSPQLGVNGLSNEAVIATDDHHPLALGYQLVRCRDKPFSFPSHPACDFNVHPPPPSPDRPWQSGRMPWPAWCRSRFLCRRGRCSGGQSQPTCDPAGPCAWRDLAG